MHHYQPKGGPRAFFQPEHFAPAARRFAKKENTMETEKKKSDWVVNIMAIGFEVALIWALYKIVTGIFG